MVNQWYNIASINELINDKKGPEKEYDGFKDHRHDQSIYSLLLKRHGSIILLDKAQEFTRKDAKNWPFWATRCLKHRIVECNNTNQLIKY